MRNLSGQFGQGSVDDARIAASCILLMLTGGPSQLDTFDLKDPVVITTIAPDQGKLGHDITVPVLSPILARKKTLAEEIAALDVAAFTCPVLPRKSNDKAAQTFRYEGKDIITLRLDRDILKWLRAQGKGYQTLINQVLRAFYNAQTKKPRREETAVASQTAAKKRKAKKAAAKRPAPAKKRA